MSLQESPPDHGNRKLAALGGDLAEPLNNDPRSGHFLPGNAFGGRKKGARSKLTEAFWSDLHACWADRGMEAINRMIDTEPGRFVQIVASRMPQEFVLKAAEMEELDDESLVEFVLTVRRGTTEEHGPEVPGGSLEEGGDRTGAPTRESADGGEPT